MAYRAEIQVRFGEVDLAGIVYYPRFLHYCHVAMEDFFGHVVGVAYADVLEERGVGLPAVHLETDFRSPLRFGDRVEVEVRVERVGRSSVGWLYVFYRQGEEGAELARARVVSACVDMEGFGPRPLPAWLREALERYRLEGGGGEEEGVAEEESVVERAETGGDPRGKR